MFIKGVLDDDNPHVSIHKLSKADIGHLSTCKSVVVKPSSSFQYRRPMFDHMSSTAAARLNLPLKGGNGHVQLYALGGILPTFNTLV